MSGPGALSAVVDLLSSLVAIDSVNPDLVAGGAGEGELAELCARWLADRGCVGVRQSTGRPGRENVVGVVPGRGGGRTLMLNAHLDTVGVAGMVSPHDPRVIDGRLYGRGALDTKGGLAAFMLAVASAVDAGLRGDVILTAVVDEEFASIGTESVLRDWHADGALVAEPTGLDLATCHKGFVWIEVETEGVAAHGSRPDDGVDAIAKMAPVLAGVDALAARLTGGRRHPLLGAGSVHASTISGGQELSSYPASCRLALERRTVPGETAADALAEVQALLDEITTADPSFRASARVTFARDPLSDRDDAEIARELAAAARAILGRNPAHIGLSGWMDAALLSFAGIPTVVFGPAGDGLHATEEWVDLASVGACSQIVTHTIHSFCA